MTSAACMRPRLFLLVGLALTVGSAPLSAQCPLTESQWLRKQGGEGQYGHQVAVDGIRLAVGAPESSTDKGKGSGLVRIYELQGETWVEEETLYPRSGSDLDRFGAGLDLGGNQLLAGGSRSREDLGRADLYDRSSGSWVHVQRLIPSEDQAFSWFGESVTIDGNWAFVAAPRQEARGAVFVYEFNGRRWVERQILRPGGPIQQFYGQSMAVRGSVLAVGAPLFNSATTNEIGTVYVYQRQGGSWNLLQRVDGARGEGDQFGTSVAVQGSRIVVGAPFEDDRREDRGAAYLFEDVAGSYVLQQRLTGRDVRRHRRLGRSVALDGDTILAGAPGSTSSGPSFVAVFRRLAGNWIEVGELQLSDTHRQDGHGAAVDLDGAQVVAGGDNRVFTHRLPSLLLAANDTELAVGDPLTLSTCSGIPTSTALLAALEFDGVPRFQRLSAGPLDANGDWEVSFTTPPGLAGHSLLVASFSLIGGRVEPSNTVELQFE